MKIATGKIIAGQIIVEGASFDEGSTVTVISVDVDDGFELPPDQEEALLKAIQQADSDDTISAHELLTSLNPKP
jgi:hypothetical protein